MNKPANWYDMPYEQQRAWERQAREREDLEYDLDRAREESLQSHNDARRRERELRQCMSERDETIASTADELDAANAELRLRDAFLKEKGLAGEFDDWASYRRKD